MEYIKHLVSGGGIERLPHHEDELGFKRLGFLKTN